MVVCADRVREMIEWNWGLCLYHSFVILLFLVVGIHVMGGFLNFFFLKASEQTSLCERELTTLGPG